MTDFGADFFGNDDEPMRAVASDLGLRYAGTLDRTYQEDCELAFPWPLPLLQQGGEGDIRGLVHGTFAGVQAAAFDFALLTYREDPANPVRSCVVLQFRAAFPVLTLNPHNRLSLAQERDRTPFGQRYRVLGRDPAVADLVLSDAMKTYLARLTMPLRIELGGTALLGHLPEVRIDQWPHLFQTLYWIYLQIPDSAWNAYAKGPPQLEVS